MTTARAESFPPLIEGSDAAEAAAGRIILVCEHASNHIPAAYANLGLTAEQQTAHIAWDSGALGLARGLMQRLQATLVHAPVSRLIYDCNRAPDMAGAMPSRSEVHVIPGNTAISAAQRLARTEAIYLPFHAALHALIARRIALGLRPVLISVHSFTPLYFGTPRQVEFGVIHDADPGLAVAIQRAAQQLTRLHTELNAPYSAADDVTHTLRLQATPYGLPNAMLEVRNDLITTPEAEQAMADQLAPVLNMGLVEIQKQAKAG